MNVWCLKLTFLPYRIYFYVPLLSLNGNCISWDAHNQTGKLHHNNFLLKKRMSNESVISLFTKEYNFYKTRIYLITEL